MGMMGSLLGAGRAAGRIGDVAEVFVGNRAERDAADAERFNQALEEYGREFAAQPTGGFDRFVNSMNRLPRPTLTLGTIGLFVYAMIDPPGFSERMQGLALIPGPLWWLMGAIVSFYFGARELHHFRSRNVATMQRVDRSGQSVVTTELRASDDGSEGSASLPAPLFGTLFRQARTDEVLDRPGVQVRASDPDFNAALDEWRLLQK
jgi:hypothetical protein